jgi:hypothetical protein
MNSKFKSIFMLIITASALAAINYTIVHSPTVFIITAILIAHELGHYFAAISNGAKADIPYIIPFPFFGIGITRIKNFKKLDPQVRKSILLFGPTAGVFTAIIILLLSFITSLITPISILIIALFEILFNYFGSDGKKYRQAEKDIVFAA